MSNPGFETICAHYGEDPERFHGAVAPPLFQNSLFALPDAETFLDQAGRGKGRYVYTRVSNPTTDILETKLAVLEKGEMARCFGSGDAAAAAAIFYAVKTGDHVVAVDTAYGPTRQILSEYLQKFKIEVTYVRGNEISDFEAAIRPNTRLFYLESPSSLIFHIQDLREITRLAKEHGILTVIDNSYSTPYFQNPIELGVDLVMHTATKYLGGHSDLVGGVVVGKAEHMMSLRDNEGTLLGGILDPFAAWLMLRGLRTLPVRMDRHQSSCLRIAEYLESHPMVSVVHHPGLESHPQHKLACSQMRGTNGLVSFEFKDGKRSTAVKFVDSLQYYHIAVSWGGYESLAIPIRFPTGAIQLTDPSDYRWGSRLHIGLETPEDLLNDLDQAFKKAAT
ncbi:MAG: PLP-dependent aspartate aminotransferase family protein [Chthonomonadales bacterium]